MNGPVDCVLNTMAFSGYPDGRKALRELLRVLKPAGRLVLIDINYPADGNRLGTWLTECWRYAGDLIRDMSGLFREFSLEHTDQEIGGWGSVHPMSRRSARLLRRHEPSREATSTSDAGV